MNYEKEDAAAGSSKDLKSCVSSSKLDKPIAEYVSLIFDTKMMDESMKQLGYDTTKMPLGKLSLTAIEKGFSILKDLSETLEQAKPNTGRLQSLSSDFYTNIPHDFGWQRMEHFVIKDMETVKQKLDLLDSLRQVQIAHKLNKEENKSDNAVDSSYAKLNCEFEVVDPKSDEYDQIKRYIDNTKGTWAGNKVKLNHVFRIARQGEDERFTKDINNHLLLWHGSRLSNFVGILSQGLRIAPPEAPSSGYRFGKGVYLADMFEKSYNYCRSWNGGAFSILLCESALGNLNELYNDDFYASNLPSGKNSTKALGHLAPPMDEYEVMKNDSNVKVPCGKPKPTAWQTSACSHNEFIVYDVKQVKLRYVLWMEG